jgi:hypothetical protein
MSNSNGMGMFEAFAPATRSAKYQDDGEGYSYDLAFMMTNGTGGIGCSLIDPQASPGQRVSRVLITIPHQNGSRVPVCGPEAYAVHGTGDAIFERWDQAGAKVAKVSAVGGAVSFAASPAGASLWRCDVSVTVTFPGAVTFSDTFSYNYDSYPSITQSCIQAAACSCQPWQQCNAQQKCVDLACVPSQATCPSDGSVACCAGSCNAGVCCLPAGTPCAAGGTDCCYRCDYLNNQIYQGWYCTQPA